ncbi:Uncharacterised protein [Vibrio cholerae]|nr:Uncharacterised protein [Vibrio cholerae]
MLTPFNSTADMPIPLGRKVAREAKTPTRSLPPRRGGRTVGFQPAARFWSNKNSSQTWLNCSMPRMDSAQLHSPSNLTLAVALGTKRG